MARKGRSDKEEKVTNGKGEANQIKTDRKQKAMNAMINTSIILMSTLMGGLTKVMMETTGALASEIAGATGGEEVGEKVNKEFKKELPAVDEQIKAMISDVRKDVYDQLEQKRKDIEPLLSDAAFDLGPKIINGYDFNLPKLTEELDDSSLARYTQLLVEEDPSFTEMFKQLANWMNTLPKVPDSDKR